MVHIIISLRRACDDCVTFTTKFLFASAVEPDHVLSVLKVLVGSYE